MAAFSDRAAPPVASTLNFSAGQLTIQAIQTHGSMHVILDVSGYFE